jgi:hypothetical protein
MNALPATTFRKIPFFWRVGRMKAKRRRCVLKKKAAVKKSRRRNILARKRACKHIRPAARIAKRKLPAKRCAKWKHAASAARCSHRKPQANRKPDSSRNPSPAPKPDLCLLPIKEPRFVEQVQLNALTGNEWRPSFLIDSSLLNLYSYAVVNRGTHAGEIMIEISPNGSDFMKDNQTVVQPGATQTITSLRYLKYTRLSFKSLHLDQPALLDIYFQAQSEGGAQDQPDGRTVRSQ